MMKNTTTPCKLQTIFAIDWIYLYNKYCRPCYRLDMPLALVETFLLLFDTTFTRVVTFVLLFGATFGSGGNVRATV